MAENRYNPWLHGVALLTATLTLVLIFMGGLVTSHQAGMSVPDWPNSYGYNMFLFPYHLWVGGIFYEHTHRLMGMVVGMSAILLVICSWTLDRRRWAKWVALGVLGAVILQGVLGGLRVVLVKLDLAVVHACLAQAFFCLAAAMAVVTSKWWHDYSQPQESGEHIEHSARSVFRVAVAAVAVIYLQLVVGALMRHYKAGLAIPDFPASYGHVLPPTNSSELQTVNAHRAFDMNLPQVTLGQVWLHFGHRIGAVLVTLAVLALVVRTLATQEDYTILRPAQILVVLLIAQVTLGILTVLWRKPADVASLHVAVGALTLVTAFVIAMMAGRIAAWEKAMGPSNVRQRLQIDLPNNPMAGVSPA